MLTLSIKQPWATLVVHGLKSIEIRRWSSRRRGRILIHAGKRPDDRPQGWAYLPTCLTESAQLRGGIIGSVEIEDCWQYPEANRFAVHGPRHLNDGGWFEPPGLFGFVLREPRLLPFHKCDGWVRFFEADHPLLLNATETKE